MSKTTGGNNFLMKKLQVFSGGMQSDSYIFITPVTQPFFTGLMKYNIHGSEAKPKYNLYLIKISRAVVECFLWMHRIFVIYIYTYNQMTTASSELRCVSESLLLHIKSVKSWFEKEKMLQGCSEMTDNCTRDMILKSLRQFAGWEYVTLESKYMFN